MKPYIGLVSALSIALVGCSTLRDTVAAPSGNSVAVSVHGVNYTAEPFRYSLIDPKDESNGVGEHIGPFSGGGIMCCYSLPKQWTPGLKVNIRSVHWLPKDAKGALPKVEKIYTVDLPPYPNGKAGELWVLRTAEGGVDLVSSDVEPGHPQWPGKVKGWPEPSLAYQRERWELYKKIAEGKVRVYRQSLDELRTNTRAHLLRNWDHDRERHPGEISRFSGPDDRSYTEYKKDEYIEGLRHAEAELSELLKEKP